MLIIRRMTEGDVGQATALEADNFSTPWKEGAFLETLRLPYAYYYVAEIGDGAMEGEGPMRSMPAQGKAMREMPMRKNAIRNFTIEEGRRVIGVCGLRNIAGEGEITNVSVDIRYRQKGVAAAMLQRALEDGAELGIEAFTLEVRCGNLPAIRLYEKFGFAGEGVRRGFYENPKEDALIMWKR